MANHRRKHGSLSSKISDLTRIATRMGHNQGQDNGELGPAIQNLVHSALSMGGINSRKRTGQRLGSRASTDDDDDDDDEDSDSSDDSETSDDSDNDDEIDSESDDDSDSDSESDDDGDSDSESEGDDDSDDAKLEAKTPAKKTSTSSRKSGVPVPKRSVAKPAPSTAGRGRDIKAERIVKAEPMDDSSADYRKRAANKPYPFKRDAFASTPPMKKRKYNLGDDTAGTSAHRAKK